MRTIKNLKNVRVCVKFNDPEKLDGARSYSRCNMSVIKIEEDSENMKMYMEVLDDENGSVGNVLENLWNFSPEYVSLS